MSTFTLDPSRNVANTGWSRTTGTSDFALLQDAVRDPTAPSVTTGYCIGGANGTKVEVGFPNQTIPGGEAVSQVVAEFFGRSFSDTTEYALTDGAGTTLGTPVSVSGQAAGAWSVVTYTGTLTQTQVNALTVKATMTAQSGANRHRWTEAYVVITTIASVTATGPNVLLAPSMAAIRAATR